MEFVLKNWEAAASVSVACTLDAGEVVTVGERVQVRKAQLTSCERAAKRNLWSATEAAELLGLSYGGFRAAAYRAARRFACTGRKVGKRTYWSDAELDKIRAQALGQGQHEY